MLLVAKACGLENAIQSDISVLVSSLSDEEAMSQFVSNIRPGMIVSLEMGHPVPVQYIRKKAPGTPAIDKPPTIQDAEVPEVKDVPTVVIVKKLCRLLQAKGFQVVTVNALIETNKPNQK
jgi:hypothetical protein